MKNGIILFIVGFAVWTATVEGRTFDRCSLARELDRLGGRRNDLPAWVCIAEHESSFRTDAIGPPNTDGSRDHGIFQINDRYWCNPQNGQFSSNGCNINCADLRTDSIAQSFRCAQKVKREQNYCAWTVWNRNCDGRLPNLDNCF